MQRAFQQVDVFTSTPYKGNPVAVVLDADELTDEQMQAFARWTNLSETTFVLPPSNRHADYRLRIFTPTGELPFAGHPTLGSAHAWLRNGGEHSDYIVQECGAGLVRIKQYADRLAFAAPPLSRSGLLDEALVAQIAGGLGIERRDVIGHQWVDNGPGWAAVMLGSAQRVLDIVPDFAAMGDLAIGVIGPYAGMDDNSRDVDFEVRAFAPAHGVPEDPVTGSLNAGLAQWLRSEGLANSSYVAAQGTAIGRTGRIHIEDDGADIWVGGYCTTRIEGSVDI
ncbi:PhzF family phenazine biosynthesis protein [Antricoccus suffuscus]|uniref:PhzF family phenazine biosynthesis protein n=1 Tax=Antricoccus suffuscus TaxID=1629062 RepID=A0A2T0ZXZ4_9ACTN|nr:PhzF family phenazine biosynthesis protein [Antricoccus suffuscus]PRZ41226.1 PhzF family phenazine biosynthesis protein [Antricoccus suffuscus]